MNTTGLEGSFFDRRVIQRILREEGGLANRPSNQDPGGLTRHGITQGTLDRYIDKQKRIGNPWITKFPDDVRKLMVDQAIEIYRTDYWDGPGFEDLPRWAAVLAFDAGVMSGPAAATRTLQTALGKIAVDGICGPQTQNRAWKHPSPDLVIDEFLKLRLRFLKSLPHASHNPGWFPRTRRVAKWARQLAEEL